MRIKIISGLVKPFHHSKVFSSEHFIKSIFTEKYNTKLGGIKYNTKLGGIKYNTKLGGIKYNTKLGGKNKHLFLYFIFVLLLSQVVLIRYPFYLIHND